jgi:hypothetical protein
MIISLSSINQVIFVMEKFCVFFAVRTGFLNNICISVGHRSDNQYSFVLETSVSFKLEYHLVFMPKNRVIRSCRPTGTEDKVSYILQLLLLFMSMGWDYVSELRPPTGILFIPK